MGCSLISKKDIELIIQVVRVLVCYYIKCWYWESISYMIATSQ